MNKGCIKVSNSMYNDRYELVKLIFNYVRPTYVEFRHWENDTWYIYGESKEFEQLKEGDLVPQYEVIFDTEDIDNITIKFNRV